MEPMANATTQPSRLSLFECLEYEAIHILREAVAEPTLRLRAEVMLWVGCGQRAEQRRYAIDADPEQFEELNTWNTGRIKVPQGKSRK